MAVFEELTEPFQRWSSTALTVGGIGILGLSVAGTLDVTGVVSSPAWLHAALGLGGVLSVFVGLFGFYSHVSGSSPRLARVGVVASALGGVALVVAIVGSLVVALTTGTAFGEGPRWGPPLLAGAYLSVLLSFLAYGVGSLRSRSPSRAIGLLLFVPVGGFLGQAALLISKIVTGDALAALQLAVGGLTALAILAVGYLLRVDTADVTGSGGRTDAPS